jgi:hypothetical protein
MPSPTEQYVTQWCLRYFFNPPRFQVPYLQRVTQRVLTYDEPAPLESDQPPGTLSQIFEFYDASSTFLGEFHQYRRPDGSIGASGRIDPKQLLVANTLYVAIYP